MKRGARGHAHGRERGPGPGGTSTVTLPANRKQPWRPLLLDLPATVAQVGPADYQVLVLADRGLYSPTLYRAICQVHWHPLLRVNNQAYFRPHGQAWRPLTGLLTAYRICGWCPNRGLAGRRKSGRGCGGRRPPHEPHRVSLVALA
jgi:hypothetical protein